MTLESVTQLPSREGSNDKLSLSCVLVAVTTGLLGNAVVFRRGVCSAPYPL